MEMIIKITLILAVLFLAILGSLYIFEVVPVDELQDLSIKAGAAILLLGGCSALISLLTGRKKDAPDDDTA
jgi:hypothetical protein